MRRAIRHRLGLLLGIWSSLALAETPTLTVYTYSSFTADWRPGPAIRTAFEAECDCTLNYVALDGLTFTPLAGLSNRSYRPDLDGERYVLRLPGLGRRNHARERHNSARAAELGLCPPVLYERSDGVRLSRHIEGRALQANDLRDPDTRAELIGLLRRLHTSGVTFRGRVELFAELECYRALAAGPLAPKLDRLCRRFEPLRAELAESADPPRPCHHDPIPNNWPG